MRARLALLTFLLLPLLADAEILIRGRILGPSGLALPDAVVQLVPAKDLYSYLLARMGGQLPSPVAQSMTGKSGAFVLKAPAPGLWSIHVERKDMVPINTTWIPVVDTLELPDAVMNADKGLLIHFAQRPKARALCIVRSKGVSPEDSPWRTSDRYGVTGEDGTLRMPASDGEAVRLTVSADGYEFVEQDVVRADELTINLKSTPPARMRIVGKDHVPSVGSLILIGPDHPCCSTDGEGIVNIGIRPGSFPLSLVSRDGVVIPLAFPENVDGLLDVTLEDVPRKPGGVVDSETLSPVPGALVWSEPDWWNATLTDGQGRFTMPVLPGAEMRWSVAAQGYMDIRDAIIPDNPRHNPRLTLHPAAAVNGVVVNAQGKPLENAGVLLTPGERGGRWGIKWDKPLQPTHTSAEGHFFFARLDPALLYRLRVQAQGYAPSLVILEGLEPRATRSGIRVVLNAGSSVSGKVADHEKNMLPGTRIILSPSVLERNEASTPQDRAEQTTNATGHFRFDHVPRGRYDLEAARKGFSSLRLKGIDVGKDSGSLDMGTLVLVAGATLRGQVLSRDQAPIDGAEITVFPGGVGPPPDDLKPIAVSDSSGMFLLEDQPEGSELNLKIHRAGYMDSEIEGVEVQSDDLLKVILTPSSIITGRIIDQSKHAIPEAQVFLLEQAHRGREGRAWGLKEQIVADDQGVFMFHDLVPQTYALMARAIGFQEGRIDAVNVEEGQDQKDLEIVLGKGAVIEGIVTASGGKPVAGAQIQVVQEESLAGSMSGLNPSTDGDGFYHLDHIVPGHVSVQALHPKYSRVVKDIEATPGLNHLDLRFEDGVDVAGKVSDEFGAAVSSVNLTLQGGGSGHEYSTASLIDGTFRLQRIPNGKYELKAQREGYAAGKGVVVEVAGTPVEGVWITMTRGGRISGAVQGLQAEFFSRVQITASTPGGGPPQTTGVDYNGMYRVVGLMPGEWTVTAQLPGTGRQAQRTAVLEQGVEELRVDLAFGGGLTLTGEVLQGDAPLSSADVTATGLSVKSGGQSRTAADGTFAIEGLDSGDYALEVKLGPQTIHREPLQMESSRNVTIRVPTARITGHVRDEGDSSPVGGASVSLQPEQVAAPQPGAIQKVTTGLEGEFELTSVSAGVWLLTAVKDGYAAKSTPVTIAGGQDSASLEIALKPTEGLTLQLLLPSGNPPDAVQIAVLDPAGRTIVSGNYTTAEQGRVRIPSVPPGTWEVLAATAGTATLSIRAAAPGVSPLATLPQPCVLNLSIHDLQSGTGDATLVVTSSAGAPYRSLRWWGPITQRPVTGGMIRLDDLPPGSWVVTVTSGDGRSWRGVATTTPYTEASLNL